MGGGGVARPHCCPVPRRPPRGPVGRPLSAPHSSAPPLQVVMGPGTGLGAAQLMWDGGAGAYRVWPGAARAGRAPHRRRPLVLCLHALGVATMGAAPRSCCCTGARRLRGAARGRWGGLTALLPLLPLLPLPLPLQARGRTPPLPPGAGSSRRWSASSPPSELLSPAPCPAATLARPDLAVQGGGLPAAACPKLARHAASTQPQRAGCCVAHCSAALWRAFPFCCRLGFCEIEQVACGPGLEVIYQFLGTDERGHRPELLPVSRWAECSPGTLRVAPPAVRSQACWRRSVASSAGAPLAPRPPAALSCPMGLLAPQ
jgi:hypothetical protein